LNVNRKYQIKYQLGANGRTLHRSLAAAIRARDSAARAAHIGGDFQGINIVAIEWSPADGHYIDASLTDAEREQIA